MHQGVLLLAAATPHEKSKTAFYIAGGVLAGWAVVVSVLSFQRPDFPGSAERARAVMGISFGLVAAAIASGIITGSTPPPAPAYVRNLGPPKGTVPPPTAAGGTGGATAPALSAGAPAAAVPAAAAAAPSAVVQIAADPTGQLRFDKTSLTAKAGKATLSFANSSPVPHNLVIASSSGPLGTTPTFAGATRTLTVTLKPGSYQFYCSVPGHRQAGMQGTLTVQ